MELSLIDALDVFVELARADGSTGWNLMAGATTANVLRGLDRRCPRRANVRLGRPHRSRPIRPQRHGRRWRRGLHGQREVLLRQRHGPRDLGRSRRPRANGRSGRPRVPIHDPAKRPDRGDRKLGCHGPPPHDELGLHTRRCLGPSVRHLSVHRIDPVPGRTDLRPRRDTAHRGRSCWVRHRTHATRPRRAGHAGHDQAAHGSSHHPQPERALPPRPRPLAHPVRGRPPSRLRRHRKGRTVGGGRSSERSRSEPAPGHDHIRHPRGRRHRPSGVPPRRDHRVARGSDRTCLSGPPCRHPTAMASTSAYVDHGRSLM